MCVLLCPTFCVKPWAKPPHAVPFPIPHNQMIIVSLSLVAKHWTDEAHGNPEGDGFQRTPGSCLMPCLMTSWLSGQNPIFLPLKIQVWDVPWGREDLPRRTGLPLLPAGMRPSSNSCFGLSATHHRSYQVISQ